MHQNKPLLLDTSGGENLACGACPKKNQSAMNRKESFHIFPWLLKLILLIGWRIASDCQISSPLKLGLTNGRLQSYKVPWASPFGHVSAVKKSKDKHVLSSSSGNSTFSSFFQSIIKWVCWDVLASSLSTAYLAYLSWCLSWILSSQSVEQGTVSERISFAAACGSAIPSYCFGMFWPRSRTKWAPKN